MPARVVNIGRIATNLSCRDDGVWVAATTSDISHPEEAQDWYLAVEDNSYWFRHRAEAIVACLRRFSPEGPVFDIGGGNGHVSLAMKNAGYDPVLVEPSADAVKNARGRGISPIICSTLADAGLKNNTLPAVGIFDVLEHIDDQDAFLSAVGQLLIPDGRLFLSVPAYNWLWSGHDDYVGHYRRYGLRRLCKTLTRLGFEIDYATYLYFMLPLPILLLRSIPTRLRLTNTSSFERFEKEHAISRGPMTRMVERLLGIELRQVKKCRRIPFGSSCLVVARHR